MLARTIRIFLVDGEPDGMRTAEIMNWTGKAIQVPRAVVQRAYAEREEMSCTGIYVLEGTDPEAAPRRRVYVGEADCIGARAQQHLRGKDFWSSLIAVVSKDENLTKAHARYLETRLLQEVTDAGTCVMDNEQLPSDPPHLPESDLADMEAFYANAKMLITTLGLDLFTGALSPSETTQVALEDMLHLETVGVHARGYSKGRGFVVVEGSQARGEETPSMPDYYSEVRRALINNGVLVEDDGGYRFTQDYQFDSPSAAASIVAGGSRPPDWRDNHGNQPLRGAGDHDANHGAPAVEADAECN